ncbi:MAG: hypothetical protein P1V36_05315 [Planctomycetota bacterium]|nr:hypothetical protein [Planctomycetota bacterium]
MRELWHAAGRSAGDPAKRRVALIGILLSAPTLLVGALLSNLLAGAGVAGLTRPLAYIRAPLLRAYEADADLAVLGYVTLQALLLACLWSFYATALQRLAAVDLTQGRREETDAAYDFAARHWRGVLGAKVALAVGVGLPLAVALAFDHLARLDGWMGGVGLALGIVVTTVLSFLAVFVLLGWLVGGLLSTPVIACEDSGSFDALSRTFGYAGAGLVRLTLWRLAFLGGVLLGSAWRALRLLAVVGVAYACLRAGAGAEALDRVERILQSLGAPAGAERLQVTWAEQLAAGVAAATLFLLVAGWLADAIARLACARMGLFLALRGAIDKLPRTHLASAPVVEPFRDAEAAGFEEAARVGQDG